MLLSLTPYFAGKLLVFSFELLSDQSLFRVEQDLDPAPNPKCLPVFTREFADQRPKFFDFQIQRMLFAFELILGVHNGIATNAGSVVHSKGTRLERKGLTAC